MRTLVDLLNTEHGYARIFYEQDSYGYQLHAYHPASMVDLFACMSGYPSALDACEAARQQLTALGPAHGQKGAKPAKTRTTRTRRVRRQAPRAARRRSNGGSMGLL